MHTVTVDWEHPRDFDAIDLVHRYAFGRSEEASLVRVLRAEGYARVGLVARCESAVVGHVLFSEIQIVSGERAVLSLALAPLAVRPEHQNKGIGSKLSIVGLDRAKSLGYGSVFVLGSVRYYGRFGFCAELASRYSCVFACGSFQAVELEPGSLDGVEGEVVYPPPFLPL